VDGDEAVLTVTAAAGTAAAWRVEPDPTP